MPGAAAGESSIVSDPLYDGVGHLVRTGGAAEVPGLRARFEGHFEGGEDPLAGIGVSHMIEHQGAGSDRTRWIGDALAGDVGRRSEVRSNAATHSCHVADSHRG